MGTIGIFISEGGLDVEELHLNQYTEDQLIFITKKQHSDSGTYTIDGYNNIQYHTPADLLPFGITAKIAYVQTWLQHAYLVQVTTNNKASGDR